MFECSKESGTNLNGFVEVDDDLGGVAGEEHDHYRHQQPRHRVVPPVIYNINIDTPILKVKYVFLLFPETT